MSNRPRFHLSTLSYVFVVAFLAATGWSAYYHAAFGSAYAAGYSAGQGMGGFLLIAIVSAIVWRVTGRSHLAGNVTLGALLILATGNTVVGTLRRVRLAEKTKQLEARSRDLREHARAELAAKGQFTGNASGAAGLATQLDEMAALAGGNDAIVMRVAARFMEDTSKASAAYQQATARIEQTGARDCSKLDSPAKIDAALEAVRAARTAGDAVAALFDGAPRRLEDDLARSGIPAGLIPTAVRDLTSQMNLPAIRRIRKLDTEALDALAGQLAILKEYFGSWSYDAPEETVLFADTVPDAVVEAFTRHGEAAGKAAAGLLAAQQKMLGRE